MCQCDTVVKISAFRLVLIQFYCLQGRLLVGMVLNPIQDYFAHTSIVYYDIVEEIRVGEKTDLKHKQTDHLFLSYWKLCYGGFAMWRLTMTKWSGAGFYCIGKIRDKSVYVIVTGGKILKSWLLRTNLNVIEYSAPDSC